MQLVELSNEYLMDKSDPLYVGVTLPVLVVKHNSYVIEYHCQSPFTVISSRLKRIWLYRNELALSAC